MDRDTCLGYLSPLEKSSASLRKGVGKWLMTIGMAWHPISRTECGGVPLAVSLILSGKKRIKNLTLDQPEKANGYSRIGFSSGTFELSVKKF